MRQKRFLSYLACQALVIVGVILMFKLGDDIRTTSAEAGGLFVLLPLILAYKEYEVARFRRKIFYAGLVQFWLLFAVPILALRLSHWEAPFAELSLLGIPGPTLHHWANPSYMVMMACTLWCYFRRELPLK